MSYYDSDDPRITIRRRKGTFDIDERSTRDRYRSNRREDFDYDSGSDRAQGIDVTRPRNRSPKEYSRSSSRLLRDRVNNIPSRYSSRSRSGGRFRIRSPSPLRRRSYYEESPPPIPDHALSRRHDQHRRREYASPIDKDGNPLNFDVNLISSAKDERGPAWGNRRSDFASQSPESLSLEASRAFIDETETEKILLTPSSKTNPGALANLRWIHLQQEHMSIKALENLVTKTPDLDNDYMLIAIRLLHQVAERSEGPFVHGHYLKATVIRGDCHSTGKAPVQQADLHCTFLSFPYFSFQAPPSTPLQQNLHLHPSRGLLQTVHLLESTKFRDAEQAICKLSRSNRYGKFIHVPQVWSIAIGRDLLITYSTMSLSSMRGDKIEIQKPLARERSGPSVLRVMDPYQRVFFFSLDLCKTWFELEDLVYTQCELGPLDSAKNDFNIFLKDKKPLTGAQWPTIVASEQSAFIDIFVHSIRESESDDSEFDADNYLQERSPSIIERTEDTYIRSRDVSKRGRRSGRASPYYYPEPRHQYQRTSTTSTGVESPHSRRLYTFDDDYPLPRNNESPAAVGTAGVAGLDNENRSSQRSNLEGNELELEISSSDTEGGSNTKFNPTRRQYVGHDSPNVTFLIEEVGQSMVAEPDSYYSSPEPDHSQSYTGSNSTGLSLSNRQQVTGRIEPISRPVRSPHSRSRDESVLHHTHHRPSRLPRPSRRRSTFTEHYNDTSVSLPKATISRSAGLENIYRSGVRRRGTVDSDPTEGLYSERRRGRNNSYGYTDGRSLRRAYPSPPLYYRRPRRGQSSLRGIVSNSATDVASIIDPEIERDIYYIPKKKREKKSVPVVNIGDENGTAVTDEKESNDRNLEQNNPNSMRSASVMIERPISSSRRDRRSGSSSSTRPVPPTKHFVLPILMWPTGPPDDFDDSPPNDIRLEDHVDPESQHNSLNSNQKGPPRARKEDSNISMDQANDSSLAEVLDRVYSSLLTDKSSNHNSMFREMEAAHQKDATFKLSEQKNSESAKKEDVPVSRDSTQGGKSKYDPAEGFLHARSKSQSTSEQAQVPEYQTKLLQLSTTANNLLECFMPPDYSSPVTWRYYGSIKRIIKIVDEAQKHNDISRLFTNQGTVWLIEDITDLDYLEKHHLQPLSKPLNSCAKCRERFSYKNEIDASNHLLLEHFPSDRPPPASTLMLWVKKHQPLSDRRRCEEHMNILRICCNHLNDIYKAVQEIRDGVCITGVAHNPRYRLPKALVVAFRKLVLFLVYTSHVLELVTKWSEAWISANWMPYDDNELTDKTNKIKFIGDSVEDAVDQGKVDLTIMLRTQDYTQSIKRYEAVGPHYILIMVLSNLQYGVEGQDLIEVYKKYIARLSFQVSQYPRRRLLRSLKYVEEELVAIYRIMTEQHNQYAYFGRVANPQSFRITTEERKLMYDLELDLINKCCFKSSQRLAACEQLIRRVQRLTDDTKTSVEINDDDHGKAILVFTVVTLVFLPLSFVASFLGMNTVDIRNQTWNQALYWIIALPVTASVVVLALVIGYKYETMRDYVERYTGKVKRE